MASLAITITGRASERATSGEPTNARSLARPTIGHHGIVFPRFHSGTHRDVASALDTADTRTLGPSERPSVRLSRCSAARPNEPEEPEEPDQPEEPDEHSRSLIQVTVGNKCQTSCHKLGSSRVAASASASGQLEHTQTAPLSNRVHCSLQAVDWRCVRANALQSLHCNDTCRFEANIRVAQPLALQRSLQLPH